VPWNHDIHLHSHSSLTQQFNIAYDKDADDKAVEEQLKKEEEEKRTEVGEAAG
jgi:hypothetical protein